MIKPLSQETLETGLKINDYRTTYSVLKWVPEADTGGEAHVPFRGQLCATGGGQVDLGCATVYSCVLLGNFSGFTL